MNNRNQKYFILITVSLYNIQSYIQQFLMSSYRLRQNSPVSQNQLYSLYLIQDQNSEVFYAKIFSIAKLQQHKLDEALQYNEEVFSDTEGISFPQHINKIIASIPNDGLFTFITQPYQTNLQNHMRTARITQSQALKIFDNVLKATYSIYANGYWHKCIRPEHFVKVGNIWKLDSLVYSEDFSKSQNLLSEYTWNSEYQPPEIYERNIQSFTDEEFLPIVVWNLGSLLLDLFFSVHKLKNYDLLKCYKGRKFTLESIKVKKTDLFSDKLSDILAYMLHYDPKKRMRLEQVFSNEYLSRQVALAFKEKHKNSLTGAPIKIFTGGKSALSSALLSKEQRQKGSKILPINELIKSAIRSSQNEIKKSQIRQTKSSSQIQTDSNSGQKVSLSSIFDIFLGKKNCESVKSENTQPQKIEEFLTNRELKIVLKMYKTVFDKSEMLTLTGEKFSEVNYKDQQKQISLISKYAVQVMSYLNIHQLSNDMVGKNNFLNLDSDQFNNFIQSQQYEAFMRIINTKLNQKDSNIAKIKNDIDLLKSSERKFLDQKQVKAFVQMDYKTVKFSQIKATYRKILKISYDVVTREYNQNATNDKLARLAMYVVYCLTIDKLYHPSFMEKNFMPYFEWSKQSPSSYILIEKLEKYFEEANIKTLVYHAKEVLERFFKL